MRLSYAVLLALLLGGGWGADPEWPRLWQPKQARSPAGAAGGVDYRLPGGVLPTSYDLTLQPDFDSFTFNGSVRISLKAVRGVSAITLHSHNLEILGIRVRHLKSWELEAAKQFLVVHLEEELPAGVEDVIEIRFKGVLNDNVHGFYRTRYLDEGGQERWLATTHFQATHARQAFPCFDEPALKASFKVHMVRPKNYTSISNMPLEQSDPEGDCMRDSFEATPPMSTYLLAFVVSDFASIADGDHSVYAKRMAVEDGRADLALASSPKLLDILAEFAMTPYTLDKIKQAAVPTLPVGAMENWGLVTYREKGLLYDAKANTASEKQGTVSVIAHEYSHQWFGDLVSPSWWEFLWLNEGFATFFEYYATSVAEPAWRMMEQFVVVSYQYSFGADDTDYTRPMSQPVGSPEEIQDIFDGIAYDKSAVVLNMLRHFLTTDTFRKGLAYYLADIKYQASKPSDLFAALQRAAAEDGTFLDGLTVGEIMDTWHAQKGYPLITATRDYSNGSIHLKQHSYLSNGSGANSEELYMVPINYATAGDDFHSGTPVFWLRHREDWLDAGADTGSWVILNKNVTGYYRVNYDGENWRRLTDQLMDGQLEAITATSRAQLIDDAFDLPQSGDLSYATALELMQYLRRETDCMPLYSFYSAIGDIDRYSIAQGYYHAFKANVIELLNAAYQADGSLDEEIDDHLRLKNRITLLYWLCYLGDGTCLRTTHDALMRFDDYVHPDLQSVTYCGGMRSGLNLERKWDYLYGKYCRAVDNERIRLITAMSCGDNQGILSKMLTMLTGDSGFRKEDRLTIFRAVASETYTGTLTALDYILNTFDELASEFAGWEVYNMFYEISIRLTSEDQRDMLKQFLEGRDLQGTLKLALTDAIANVEANLDWLSKHKDTFTEFYH